MYKSIVFVLLLSLAAGVLVGCPQSKTKKVEAPPPPPPPTPEEIASDIRRSLNVLNTLPPGLPVSPEVNNQVLGGLRSSKNKHQSTENGKKALNIIANELKSQLTTAQEAKHWFRVLLICDALQILSPGTPRYEQAKEEARVQINRPKVFRVGFFEDPVQTTVFLTVFLPETGQTQSVKVREGQEFLGLKLVNIIGKNRGVNLEYLRTGDQFKVLGPTPATARSRPLPAPGARGAMVAGRRQMPPEDEEEEEDY
jgi:hypothetical protein